MITNKNKCPDPFSQYLADQLKSWESKFEDLLDNEVRYHRRQDAVQKQLSYFRVKLKAIAESKKECEKQIQEAQAKLQEITKAKT